MLSTAASSAANATGPSSSTSPPPFLHSPNAIPPRRSSTGQHQQQQQQPFASLPKHSQQPQQSQRPRSSHQLPLDDSQPPAIPSRQRHHHTSSSSSNVSIGASKSASMLRSVPEGDWITGANTRRPRKPSITMASLTGAGSSAASTASTSGPAVSENAGRGVTSHHSGTHATLTPIPSFSSASASALPATLQPTPPPDPNRYASEDFNFGARRTWTEEKERIVCGPFDYLNNVRGKEFRTQLVNAFNGWLEVPAESLEVITRVVGMLHTASLLVDDVEDSSSLRRGLPVAHNIFGVPQTINSANYIYFLALQEVQRLRNPRALVVFSEELCNLHRGQGMDLFWRDTLTCPTEDDYLEMVGNKTGGLFRLGIKLMQAESRSLVDCVPLVNLLGLLFQIQDDYRNLLATEYSQNKGLCEDLTEGKFSFPVIHSIRSTPNNLQLLNILRQRTSDEEVKRYAVTHMEQTGSFAYTRQVMAVLTKRARNLADALDEGKGRSRAVHAILDRLEVE